MTVTVLPGDYRDSEGFLCCGKCHTRKERFVKGDKTFRVPSPCKCRQTEIEEKEKFDKQIKLKAKIDNLQSKGITDRKYYDYRFENDDNSNPKYTKICKRYVEEWDKMKLDNMGILFCGSVGTGKTFLACCVANALLDNLVPICITNFPKILNKMQTMNGNERQKLIDDLQRYQLLVIDDLGTERDTQYTAEQVFNIVDTRLRSNLPTLITTNLSIEEMENTRDMQYHRIYDRILEMCPIRIVMSGDSHRKENAAKKREKALKLLWE